MPLVAGRQLGASTQTGYSGCVGDVTEDDAEIHDMV